MPPIPSNPIDPTFKIIKQDLKYYLTIGDDSIDFSSKIIDEDLSVLGSIPLANFTGPFLSVFDLLNIDWSSLPQIFEVKPLFL